MPSILKLYEEGELPGRDVYHDHSRLSHKIDFYPGVVIAGDDPEKNLRTFLIQARREGLTFRFWAAHKTNDPTIMGLHVSFPTHNAYEAFDSFVEKTNGYAPAP